MNPSPEKRTIKVLDMHSHFGTKKGYLWRTKEEIENAQSAYRYKVIYRTEKEQAQDLRDAGVKAILDYSFTSFGMPIEEVREFHDYAAQLIKDDPDVYTGLWVALDPRSGLKGVRELERCFKDLKIAVGFTSMSSGIGLPPSDKLFYPFYDMCAEANGFAHLMVGYTGWGALFPGGYGVYLEHCHPRYVDEVAIKFPHLKIIAARPAWPWQTEMIAVVLHKANVVGYELHGWSPKYFTQDLKWDISHRLQDKIMFGGDYPIFGPNPSKVYERLFNDWESEGYSEAILEKVYYENAYKLLKGSGYLEDLE